MSVFQVCDTVGELVARRPSLSRYFEKAGIDYCCCGKITLEEACEMKGLDPQSVLDGLDKSALAPAEKSIVDAASMSLTELADHIEQMHHAYLRKEFSAARPNDGESCPRPR